MDPSTADFLKSMASVTLGWVLGLGSGAITQWRRDRKRQKATRKAIRRELRETAHRMLALIYTLEQRHGGFNRQLLEWMQPQIERYEGPSSSSGMLAGVRGLLANNTDAQLAQFAAQIQLTIPPQQWPLEEASYTTGAVANLHEHDPAYVVRVLDILSHIRMLNEARDNNLYYLRLTFTPGLSAANHDAVTNNMSQAEQLAVRRARIIVERITELEHSYLRPANPALEPTAPGDE